PLASSFPPRCTSRARLTCSTAITARWTAGASRMRGRCAAHTATIEAPLLAPGEAPRATGRALRLLVPDVDALGRAIVQGRLDVLALARGIAGALVVVDVL